MYTYYLIISFILGIVMGSFVNAWAWRLTNGESISRGRSHCALCRHMLKAADLVPIVSYCLLKGRCRYCRQRISPRYIAAEIISGFAYLGIAAVYIENAPIKCLQYMIMASLLLALALVDIDTFEIRNRFIIGLGVLGLLCALVNWIISYDWKSIIRSLGGAVSVSVPLLVIVLIADRLMKRETMGGGDIKLFFVIGLNLEAPLTFLTLFISCIIGIIFGAVYKKIQSKYVSRNDGEEQSIMFPFGPSIAMGAYLAMIIGRPIIEWYGSFF